MSYGIDVIAFAPHPDDVELFCGGIMIRLADLGYRTGVVDLTRGELATNGTVWQVADTLEVEVDGRAGTMVAATALTADAGIPVDASRVAYLIDAGEVGTLVLSTVGAADDPIFARNAAVLTLMIQASTFGPPPD